MHADHALNLYDSLHTMPGMESPKPSGSPAPPGAQPHSSSIRRQSRQHSATDSIQQRCQQSSQQQ